VRVVSPDGARVVAQTKQLTGFKQLAEVKACLCQGLHACGVEVPAYLQAANNDAPDTPEC
jgi:hypothetical protein